MKKFLSLVLALVMAMSLVTVSAGAEYKDAADIQYDEAVAVLSALDVVGGSKGNFMPKGTLTRGAAAKIICNVLAGPDAALDASAAPFSDVAAGSTFGKYINYLASKDIVGGYGDGTYRPSAGQSGYAYLKMLLGVIGYSSDVEGYSGSGWQARALAQAEEAGLLKGMKGFVPTATITRDNAAMLAFNALKATMVRYEGGINVGTSDGTTVTVGADREEILQDFGIYEEYDEVDGSGAFVQYVEKKFPDLKKVVRTASDADDFGRAPAYAWELDGEEVYAADPDAALVYTAAVDESKDAVIKTMRSELEKAGVKLARSADGTEYYFADAPVTSVVNGGDSTAYYTVYELAAMLENGKTVEVYVDEDAKVVTDIIVMDYDVETEVVVDVDDETGDVTYTVNSSDYIDYADNTYDDDTVFVVGDVKDGDVVTYIEVGSNCYVWATSKFTGNQTAINKAGTVITVGGKQYTLQCNEVADFVNSTEKANYYVDQFGYVVYTDSIASTASTDYVYVLDQLAKVTESLGGLSVTATIKGLLADGTVAEFDVELKKATNKTEKFDADGNVYYKNDWLMGDMVVAPAASSADDLKYYVETALADGSIYGYTKSGSTLKMEFVAASATPAEGEVYTAAAADLDKATINYSGVMVNAKTVFVVYNSDDKAATVYTGGAALPTFESTVNGTAVAKVDADLDSNAVVVFASTTADVATTATDDYVFIDGSKYDQVLSGDESVYQYTGTYANGKTVVLTAESALAETKALYIVNEDKTVGDAYADAEVLAEADLDLKNGVLTYDSSEYYYVVDATKTVYVGDYKKVDGGTGIVVLAKKDGALTKNVAVIFVTDEQA